jgi:hypothetical protein
VEIKRSVKFHRFGLGDAGGPIDSRVGDLCNHIGFTDVAAPRDCWRLFEQKKLPDWQLREGDLREKRAKTDLLYLKFNSLSFGFTWFRVNRTTNKRAIKKNRKYGRHSDCG